MIRALSVDTLMLRNLPPAEPIQDAAAELLSSATQFSEAITSVRNKWSALDGLYSAPEREQVLQAMDTPSQQSGEHLENVSTAAKALNVLAAELADIDTARIAVEDEAEAEDARLRPEVEEIHNDNPDRAHAMWDDARAALQAKITQLEHRYEAARATCEAALGDIVRVSSHVVSTYDSPYMDLESEGAADLTASFANATKPDATDEDVAAFYRLLGEMGPAQLAAFAAAVPAASLFVKGMGAYQEASFWKSLTPAQRDGLAKSMPGLVGNLEGAPYAVRDQANRKVLEEVLLPGHDATEEQREAYRSIWNALGGDAQEAEKEDGKPHKMLISFEPGHDHPLAAIAVGDLDEASNTTYLVPGMDNYSTGMGSLVNDAGLLLKEQQLAKPGTTSAVVAYMGYETPGLTDVVDDSHADRGAPDFANALDGLHLTRTADGLPAPVVNVLAHSYGTTMTTKALGITLYPINSAVFIGSAGVEEHVTAEDLNVDRGADGRRDIYVSTAEADELATFGIDATEFIAYYNSGQGLDTLDEIRVDPTDEEWGGKGFTSDGFITSDGEVLLPTEEHHLSEYLKEDSSSLRGIVLATTGDGWQLVNESDGQ
ncbi:alpha/beta hydrolase family protein [Arthrobacter sp. zg-Y859]|uniref:Alpha/beta hydrolase family protein n=1 Tax=Arthrobacter jinronghuae TaxID=2964609 RepID=A0ABT1NSN9_9MICC|nr:alpha/beta hydrolase [Arthrobacter jinronghuae]MCQ1950698.1 alpha/beta hydrolase family protein [Arthrobacter jinronghuae]UWX79172.1 alpha/beta hydrolase family protein [Arthrobacter jinronghuae]